MDEHLRPLDGILVLDFSQFLAGPVAAMRLADLGARVIKIERPGGGDIGRQLAFAGRVADGDTISFHAMNRNKEGITADLKNGDDLRRVKELIAHADVLIQNFRPGVMERIGLDYESVRQINPGIIYGSASGYGDSGPWRDRPGQDLLAQSVSGLPWLSGGRDDGPVPVGLSIADHLTSCHLAQGITALLVRKARTGIGWPGADQPAGGHAGSPVRAAEHPPERPERDRFAGRSALRARLPAGAVRHLSDQ